jgi:hypothetical protein
MVVDEGNVTMPYDRPTQVLRLSELQSRVPLTLSSQMHTNTSCPMIDDNNMAATTTTTTLVTHMSADRGVWLVGEYCRRWHPLIIPVQQPSIVLVVSFTSEAAYAQRAPAWDACPHMEVVAVVNDLPRNDTSVQNYPVNLLRNLGLARVRTSHVLVLDADFLPSVALADDIRDALQVRAAQPRDGSPEALVVPVFAYDVADPVARQAFWDDPSQQAGRLPGTFDELVHCTQPQEPACTVFHALQFPPGHSTTQTERWLARDWYEPSRHGRDIRRIECLKSTAWEPYVAVPWCSTDVDGTPTLTPFFDERFQNYGFNKIQWINHVRLLGFRFFVVPQGTCWFRSILKLLVFERPPAGCVFCSVSLMYVSQALPFMSPTRPRPWRANTLWPRAQHGSRRQRSTTSFGGSSCSVTRNDSPSSSSVPQKIVRPLFLRDV